MRKILILLMLNLGIILSAYAHINSQMKIHRKPFFSLMSI